MFFVHLYSVPLPDLTKSPTPFTPIHLSHSQGHPTPIHPTDRHLPAGNPPGTVTTEVIQVLAEDNHPTDR